MASRLSPASSQSSLSASNSSLYEPERRPPDPAAPVLPKQQQPQQPDPASEPCASFTIKRKKKKNLFSRAASIADPSPSALPSSPSPSSVTSSSSPASSSRQQGAPVPTSFPVPTFDIEDLRIAFSLMDTNKDGRISMLELRDTLSALGFSADFSASEIQQMVHAASDGKDSMSENEFITWITATTCTNSSLVRSITSSIKHKRSSSSPTTTTSPSLSSLQSSSTSLASGGKKVEDPELDQDLRAAFAVFDQDGNGFLSRSELRDALRVLREEELTDQELDRLMQHADKDGDGRIGYEDFFASIASFSP